jgi:hypothetical protein
MKIEIIQENCMDWPWKFMKAWKLQIPKRIPKIEGTPWLASWWPLQKIKKTQTTHANYSDPSRKSRKLQQFMKIMWPFKKTQIMHGNLMDPWRKSIPFYIIRENGFPEFIWVDWKGQATVFPGLFPFSELS